MCYFEATLIKSHTIDRRLYESTK